MFGGECNAFMRMGEMPGAEQQVPEAERDRIMHVAFPILDGTLLMGTDVLESRGQELRVGNNTTINLQPDTLAQTQRLFDALSEGATDVTPLQLMFWGDHWGTCLDRYGVRWTFTCPATAAG